MSRQLTAGEKKKIKDLITKMGPELTCAQPSFSQAEAIAEVPGQIKALLIEQVVLSDNDLLIDYVEDLNTGDNQDTLHCWLLAIKSAKTNLINTINEPAERLYRNLFAEAYLIAKSTDLNFSITALNALASFPFVLNREKLLEMRPNLIALYKRQNSIKELDAYGEKVPCYISPEELLKDLARQQRPLLWRSKSCSVLPKKSSDEYHAIHPLKRAVLPSTSHPQNIILPQSSTINWQKRR